MQVLAGCLDIGMRRIRGLRSALWYGPGRAGNCAPERVSEWILMVGTASGGLAAAALAWDLVRTNPEAGAQADRQITKKSTGSEFREIALSHAQFIGRMPIPFLRDWSEGWSNRQCCSIPVHSLVCWAYAVASCEIDDTIQMLERICIQ